MRGLVYVGIIFIIAGIAGLIFNFIPIHHQEQVAKIGSLTATQDKETDVVIPNFVAIAVIVVGGGLVFAGRTR